MTIETPKSKEIKRLTTPLTFKNSKAYDSNGNLVKCSETLSDVRLTVEPNEGILLDDEILQFAPLSKAASKVRLKKGFGNTQDLLLVHESVPWILGLYYIILISIAIPVFYARMRLLMFIILILSVIPLVYLYRIFRYDSYRQSPANKQVDTYKNKQKEETPVKSDESTAIESLKKYEKEINNLKVLFNVKQEVVRDLIKKRFEPPQITYDKFINTIDKSQKLFNTQAESAMNIINLAVEDTPRIESELDSKIDSMKKIINQIEELTNELVININSTEESSGEVKILLDDMENLIDSIKDY